MNLIKEVYGIDTDNFNRDKPTLLGITHPLDETPGFSKDTGFDDSRSGLHTPRALTAGIVTIPKGDYLGSPIATSWQKEFYKRVLDHQDTIVAVPPAAGKTSPILNAWFKMLIEALNRGVRRNCPEFPRILYLAKTKQLAAENRIQNFIGDKETGLFNLIASYADYFPEIRINDFNPPGPLHLSQEKLRNRMANTPLTNNQIQEVYKLINEMVGFLTGGIPINNLKNSTYTIKPIIISTPIDSNSKSIVSLLKQYKDYFDIIVIDEFQQYLPRPKEGLSLTRFSPDIEKDFELVTGLIKNSRSSGQCGIQILTGTINKKTLEEFTIIANKQYNRDFVLKCEFDPVRYIPGPNKMIKNPEFTANRSSIKVVPFEKMESRQELLNLITQIVKGRQTNSIIVIFSVKRAAVKGIFGLVEDLLNKLPVRFQHTNPGFIGPKQNIANKSLSGKLIDDNSAKNYFGNFGHNTNLKDLTKIYSGNYISPNYEKELQAEGELNSQSVSDIEYLKYFDIDQGEDRKLEAKHNNSYEGNILYQGVLRGIGVITGPMPDRMKMTIQKLFRDGKIYVILATDIFLSPYRVIYK